MKPAAPIGDIHAALPLPIAGASVAHRVGARSRIADYVALTKPRLNTLVIATAAAGFYLAGGSDPGRLLIATLGTALVAGGAAALNQVYERRTDALMHRTRTRPLPDGRLQNPEAIIFGTALAAGGIGILAAGSNALAALVALATLVTYLAVYTPMKLRTPLSTLVGAVPGALPPVIGWTAASDRASLGGWTLFAIVFLWQIPHFLAIAWMYRDDYRRAGFPLLPIVEPDGRSTGRQAVLFAAALVPVSVAPAWLGIAGWIYVAGALVLGLGLLALALRFAADRTTLRARALFLGSIAYLPLIWLLMIANATR